MESDMFIPVKLKVGFSRRTGTTDGKLAYVTYYDTKGVLRKESSWESWRDKTIDSAELENTPQVGFFINRDVRRGGYDWYSKSVHKVWVYDPRGFEVEITVNNLIALLTHSDVTARQLTQSCVYSWHGTDLVLLPINSAEYQTSVSHTAKQSLQFSAKDLVVGQTYNLKKDRNQVVYLGRFDQYASIDHDEKTNTRLYAGATQVKKPKKHVFYDTRSNHFTYNDPASYIADVADTTVSSLLPEAMEKYYKMYESTPISEYALLQYPYGQQFYNTKRWYQLSPTEFVELEFSATTLGWHVPADKQALKAHVIVSRVAVYFPSERMIKVSYDNRSNSYNSQVTVKVSELSVEDVRIVSLIEQLHPVLQQASDLWYIENKEQVQRRRMGGNIAHRIVNSEMMKSVLGEFKHIMLSAVDATGEPLKNSPYF